MIEIPKPQEEKAPVEFTIADVQQLLDESQHAFLSSMDSPNETMQDRVAFFISDPEFRILGYEEDGVPASYIMALSDRKRSDSLAIGPMYVGKDHRGKGLGKKQLEGFIEYAKEKGCKTIFTKTWAGNEASRLIFDGFGFEVESIKEGDRANGDSTINYVLYLQ